MTSKIILLLEQRNILKYFKVLGSEILSISIEYINIGRSFLSLNKTRHTFPVIKTIYFQKLKMHSSFKISNLSDSQPLNIGVPSLYKVHSDRKTEEVKIYVDLGLEVSKLSATTEEQEEHSESSQRLKEISYFTILI